MQNMHKYTYFTIFWDQNDQKWWDWTFFEKSEVLGPTIYMNNIFWVELVTFWRKV